MRSHRSGFTLVELLVSFALTALLLTTLFYTFGQALHSWKRCVLKNEVQQAAGLVANKIICDIRAANQITSASSYEIGLKIESDIVSYQFINNKVGRKINNGSIAYLTSENEINSLSFSFASSEAVIVSLEGYACYVSKRN